MKIHSAHPYGRNRQRNIGYTKRKGPQSRKHVTYDNRLGDIISSSKKSETEAHTRVDKSRGKREVCNKRTYLHTRQSKWRAMMAMVVVARARGRVGFRHCHCNFSREFFGAVSSTAGRTLQMAVCSTVRQLGLLYASLLFAPCTSVRFRGVGLRTRFCAPSFPTYIHIFSE